MVRILLFQKLDNVRKIIAACGIG